jgi:hypothetical protein
MMKYHVSLTSFVCVCVFVTGFLNAQNTRFIGNYPIASPSNNILELKPEFEQTVAAMYGGLKLLTHPNTPTNHSDAEALTKEDYKKSLDEMLVYANSITEKYLSIQAGSADWKEKAESVKKWQKTLKSDKYNDLIATFEPLIGDKKAQAENIYFIWKSYLHDQKQNAVWLKPENAKETRVYRKMIDYVNKEFERPYGVLADEGAIVANTAQALSNVIGYPEQLGWQGEGDFNFEQNDELKRLISNLAYLEWKLHDPTNARRSAKMNLQMINHIQFAAYEVITNMVKHKKGWLLNHDFRTPLLVLYQDTDKLDWTVNGDKAQKKVPAPKTVPVTENPMDAPRRIFAGY